MDLLNFFSPAYDAPGPEGMATPLLGLAILAAIVWRVGVWTRRIRQWRREWEEQASEDKE